MSSQNVDITELRLIERATAGERDAQRELFERYRTPAYQVALRITGRPEDALDVVQDSFMRAFERLSGFQFEAGFKTWFLRIVTNRALDLLRSRKVRRAVPIDHDDEPGFEPAARDGAQGSEDPGAALERGELAERLHGAVATLPLEQRAVFALHAASEMTYGQIAEVLGIPVGTVMSRLYHARRRLRALLPDLAPPGLASDAD
ncbi:MAG: sigma-70 family RNA polymerase sigma factor [Planctomycetes bacterium]|nr:sigma-70 family RNA polymerase sigma factor [Planctomycetota bacterium]